MDCYVIKKGKLYLQHGPKIRFGGIRTAFFFQYKGSALARAEISKIKDYKVVKAKIMVRGL